VKKISIVLALLIVSGCGSTTKAVATAAVDIGKTCAEEPIISKASQILPAILAILTTPSNTWKDQAQLYVKAYGQDVAVCAARTALDKLTAPVQSEANPTDPEAVKRTATARVREMELEAGYSNQ
jgi:hypothetical protein